MRRTNSLSVRKIAELTGLSTATVSRAMNNSDKVSREAKQKIMKVLQDNGAAGTGTISAHHVIGCIVASAKSDYYVSLMQNVIRYFDDRGDAVISFFADEHKFGGMDALRVMKDLHVDGIIVISFQDLQYHDTKDLTAPIVYIDSNITDDSKVSWVTSDQYISGRLAANTLLAKGCTKPLLIAGRGNSPRGLLRNQGFRDSLTEHGLTFEEDRIIHCPLVGNPYEEGRSAVMYQHAKGVEFDSIFAVNDWRALGAVMAAKELGYKVPEEIKIIGLDGISIASNSVFHITSVHQNTPLIAQTACDILVNEMNGDHSVQHVVIPVQLSNGETA